MGTRSNIAYEQADGKVIVTYCHYDGYPEYNGRIINKYYNNKAKAKELANVGYLSGLKSTIAESIEDRVHEDKPKVYDNIRQYLNDVNWDIEFAYLYSNEQWYILDDMMKVDDDYKIIDQNFKPTQFKPLWSVLARLEKVLA